MNYFVEILEDKGNILVENLKKETNNMSIDILRFAKMFLIDFTCGEQRQMLMFFYKLRVCMVGFII